MSQKIKFFMFIFLMNLHSGCSQILACGFRNDSNYGYICDLLLYNPSGTYNFSRISGTHLPGKTNQDVRFITRTDDSNSTTVPSLICDTFQNTIWIYLNSIGIQKIDENVFENCKKLEFLNLNYNRILKLDEKLFNKNLNLRELHFNSNRVTTLPANIFSNQQNITILDLTNNQIEDLPKNVFKTLKQVPILYLDNNKLKVFHAFGFSSILKTVLLRNNQIEAFDQNFIDGTGVQLLYMSNNSCANVNINDTSPSRLQMRMLLVKCFDNYLNLPPDTSTTSLSPTTSTTEMTLPPECIEGDLDERVCRLEDKNEVQNIINEEQSIINEEFKENFYHQENINRNVSASIEELQNKISELTNRPCACQENT